MVHGPEPSQQVEIWTAVRVCCGFSSKSCEGVLHTSQSWASLTRNHDQIWGIRQWIGDFEHIEIGVMSSEKGDV